MLPSNPLGKSTVTCCPEFEKLGPYADVWLFAEFCPSYPNSFVLHWSRIYTRDVVYPPVLHIRRVKVILSVVISVVLLAVFVIEKVGPGGGFCGVNVTPHRI